MMTDEIKSSTLLKFGYQEIYPGEEVFFAISTKHFKNFEFEKKENQQDQSIFNRSNMLNSKTNRFLQFAHNRDHSRIPFGNSFIGTKDGMMNYVYRPYGDFQIAVWMLVQIQIEPSKSSPASRNRNTTNNVRLIVK